MTTDDERFMTRALELAAGPARTTPNPRVGAVLVRDGLVLAEAQHEGAGRPHAEVLALEGADARGATLYLTLEPCIHQGRTPPCAPAVVEAGLDRVVVASFDPDVRANGGGIEFLRAAGCRVDVGVLGAREELLNSSYRHQRRTGRPRLTLKLAMSLDGRVAAADGSSQWITGPEARAFVHRRRAEVDAILVGAGTVVADDPALTARDANGDDLAIQPAVVVIDSSGRTPSDARLFAAPRDVKVVGDGGSSVDLARLVEELSANQWLEIYCEGGPELGTSLIEQGLVDRIEFHFAPKLIGAPGFAIGDLGIGSISEAFELRTVDVIRAGDDVIVVADAEKEAV